jgi:hypothetical protein
MSSHAAVLPSGAYKEERPQLQQFIPEKPKVGHPEAARPSAVSNMFAVVGASFGRPLFPTLVSPITAIFDVQFDHSPPGNVCGWDDWDQFPVAMKPAVPTIVFEHVLSFRERATAAGGYTESRNPRLWDWDAAAVINTQTPIKVAFKSFTGLNRPIPAVLFEEYNRAGPALWSFEHLQDGEPARSLRLPAWPMYSDGFSENYDRSYILATAHAHHHANLN